MDANIIACFYKVVSSILNVPILMNGNRNHLILNEIFTCGVNKDFESGQKSM